MVWHVMITNKNHKDYLKSGCMILIDNGVMTIWLWERYYTTCLLDDVTLLRENSSDDDLDRYDGEDDSNDSNSVK